MTAIQLVSIIVPIYNVEAFLDKCISSIIKQTYKNYELILVNDGSTDDSESICENYLDDARVHYYKKQNGGLSDARNYGLSKACGSHVTFVDPDDYLHPEYLQTLVEMFHDDVQVSCICECRVTPNEKKTVNKVCTGGVLDGTEALRSLCLGEYFGTTAWGKLYDIHMFDDIKFPVGVIHEDIWTIPYVLEKASKVAYNRSPLYFYVQQKDSIMHKPLTEATYNGFGGIDKLVDYVNQKYAVMHDEVMKNWICRFFGIIINRLVFEENYYEKAKELRTKYKKNFEHYYANRHLNKMKKIQCFLFLHSLPLLRVMMKAYIRKRGH